MRIAANITTLFPDRTLAERVDHAARLGFDGVECLFPYGPGVEALRAALRRNGLPLVLINTPVDDWEAGARGQAACPGATTGFDDDFGRALALARALDVPRIHVMSGNTGHADAFATLVNNLRCACTAAPERRLLIEPLNAIDMPGYFLNDFDRALRVIDAVGAPNLALQFDAWHAHRMGHDPAALWENVAARVGHVQIAGLAARGAPDPAAPRDARVLAAIARGPAPDWISAEYLGGPDDRAQWLPKLRARLGIC